MSKEQVTMAEIRAFKSVFGTEDNRTQAQRFVWERMKGAFYLEQPCFVAQVEYEVVSDGGEKQAIPVKQTYDPVAAASTDGMRRAMIFIKERVEAKSQDDSE